MKVGMVQVLPKHMNYLDDLTNQENPVGGVLQTKAPTEWRPDSLLLCDNTHESLMEKHENTAPQT